MPNDDQFGGYKWKLHTAGRRDVQSFIDNIDWHALCQFASKLNDGKHCAVGPQCTNGGSHLVRIINFQDGSKWIARLRMITLTTENEDVLSGLVQREVDCMQLVKERTTIPVPTVFGYNASARNEIGASFMLMECLSGNVITDLNDDHHVPAQHKSSIYAEMARFQTEMSSIMFSKIGTIFRAEDGTYDVGPLHFGGPFNTATEYLKAWARNARFATLSHLPYVKEGCGEHYEEIVAQIEEFPHKLEDLAAIIPMHDHGPFPLFHVDFGHLNIIVDDAYNVLSVIDWDHARSVPWECVSFPMTLRLVPVPMDAPWNYDENGIAKNEKTRTRIDDTIRYISTVQEVERSKGLSSLLSTTLADQANQDLASGMRLYTEDGKLGFYTKILDVHHKTWSERKKDADISEEAGNSKSLEDGALSPGGALP